MVWPKICLFGDSITRRGFNIEEGCWASLLQDKLGDYFDVDARGFSGYNSRWCLDLMPKLFPKHYLDHVEVFVLMLGHNDSWDPRVPLHVPVEEYERNMSSILEYLFKNGLAKQKVIIVTPHWYNEEAFTKYQITVGRPDFTKKFESAVKYSDAVKRIAAREQIELLDAFEISTKHEPQEELFCDGLHLSVKGAKVFFQNLWPLIDKKIVEAFKKPVDQLFHAPPYHEIPCVKEAMERHIEKSKPGK